MYLRLWNTWIDKESSQIEEVDFGNKIYYFFLFSFFCDCICVCFCVRFCLYSFAFTICPRVLSNCFFGVFLLLKNFFLIIIFLYFILITLFYFTLFYFILPSVYLSFFVFFLPFILSRVDDRVWVLRPGVRPVPLRWESLGQDIGPPETSQLHIISNGENLPEMSISTPRPSSTQQPASYSAAHPTPNN